MTNRLVALDVSPELALVGAIVDVELLECMLRAIARSGGGDTFPATERSVGGGDMESLDAVDFALPTILALPAWRRACATGVAHLSDSKDSEVLPFTCFFASLRPRHARYDA